MRRLVNQQTDLNSFPTFCVHIDLNELKSSVHQQSNLNPNYTIFLLNNLDEGFSKWKDLLFFIKQILVNSYLQLIVQDYADFCWLRMMNEDGM